jgi:signal transduction histidine kinase/CheY-like chemotaxis protein
MKLKQLYIMLFLINIAALIFVVLMISEYQNANKQLDVAYKMQHRSLILADELRQSSDDLTRMARTYVVTGDKQFKEQFQTVLDIRNGVIPRPKIYNHIYWDFLTLKGSKPLLNGKKIPLRELMKEAGFPETELELLYKSQKESDDLTHLETKAMNAVQGIFQDKDGNYSIKGKPDLEFAAKIMHGERYHKAKISIMKPLNEFYKAFEKRTQQKVNEAHQKVKKLESSVAIAVFVLILLVLFSFFILLSRIVYPLETLKNSMLGLSRNDMDTLIPDHIYHDEVGDMIGSVEIFKQNAIKLIQKEEKLKKAIKEVQAANRSKSVFLANMSHELRTPLNAILGFTLLLKKANNLREEQKENLQTIENSGQHLLTIINEILELSKIEAGKIKIVNSDFDLLQTIEDIKAMFANRYKNKNIDFIVKMSSDLPQYIISDEQRLRQIIINLLSNALKFTKKGAVTLNIELKDKKLYFEVIDTGIGIEKKELKNIFKPFEQVRSDNKIQKGTGLGLSITKELVKLMGGKIDVESVLDKGSSFYFNIVFEASSNKNIKQKFIQPKRIKGIKQFKEHLVLVVDDIKENRELLVEMLNIYDIKTIEAVNGKEAIDIIDINNIDMVFMDIAMPKLDGFEATSIIKKDKNYKNIPIVIVSAHVLKADEQKALKSGADDFISKPIDENRFNECLKKFLEVEFIYENDEYEEKINLTKEIIEKLNLAIQNLDIESIKKILEKENIEKTTKDKVVDMANRFEFDKLKNLLKL